MTNWQTINRKRIRHIRSAQFALVRMMNGLIIELSESLQGYESVEALQNVADNFRFDQQKFWDIWYKIYTETGLDFAQFHFRQIKGKSNRIETKDINDTIRRNIWTQKLLEYVDSECGDLIQNSIRTMYKGIQGNARKAIAMAAEEGWGADRTAKEMIKIQGQMNKAHAMRIARTEVVRASNEGAFEGADATGLDLKKVWISASDARTRTLADGDFDHDIMNGEKVDMNEPFNVNGDLLQYPGDPDGEPGNTINCRCTLGFEPKQSLL